MADARLLEASATVTNLGRARALRRSGEPTGYRVITAKRRAST